MNNKFNNLYKNSDEFSKFTHDNVCVHAKFNILIP